MRAPYIIQDGGAFFLSPSTADPRLIEVGALPRKRGLYTFPHRICNVPRSVAILRGVKPYKPDASCRGVLALFLLSCAFSFAEGRHREEK